jgi:hypothetical protein
MPGKPTLPTTLTKILNSVRTPSEIESRNFREKIKDIFGQQGLLIAQALFDGYFNPPPNASLIEYTKSCWIKVVENLGGEIFTKKFLAAKKEIGDFDIHVDLLDPNLAIEFLDQCLMKIFPEVIVMAIKGKVSERLFQRNLENSVLNYDKVSSQNIRAIYEDCISDLGSEIYKTRYDRQS